MRPFRYCFLTVQHESGWCPRLESPDSGMSRDFLCSAAGKVLPWPALPAGRDFGPVRTCGAFPPTAARRAPHRSRSHGRLRRPKSLPIRHSPAAAQCFSPWAGGITSVLTSWLASIRKFGLEIGNHCTEIPETSLLAAAIAKLTPSNQESLHGLPLFWPFGCIDSQVWA